jgi:phage terminase large subunit
MTVNNYEASVVFKRNYSARSQVVINQGGTSSGKTYAIMQVLFCLATEKEKQIITVAGQDIPNLKAGALRDALNIYEQLPALKQQINNYNKTDRIFEFHNGSLIEFRSYANAQDAKSGKRDYLFVNEANGITWDIYDELALRTKARVFTASIVISVMTTYFQLKNDIHDVRSTQETQARINEIRLKVLEGNVALLRQEVDALMNKKNP